MARLLIDDEWYEAIDGRSWYERDFESVVEAHAHALFPSCHVIPFKIAVESEHGRKVPDLALVDTAYREWSVVEIEMAHHSLRGHVIPQVEVFAQGAYGEEHIRYLAGRLGSPDPMVVSDMIKGAQPRVLVVVNEETPDWAEPIRRAGGELLVVEVFRSVRNHHSLRVVGTYASGIVAQVLTACRLDPMLPNMLVIDSPAGLGIAHGQGVTIMLDDRRTEWERLDVADRVWLSPVKRNPLAVGREYEIEQRQDGRLAFRSGRSVRR